MDHSSTWDSADAKPCKCIVIVCRPERVLPPSWAGQPGPRTFWDMEAMFLRLLAWFPDSRGMALTVAT